MKSAVPDHFGDPVSGPSALNLPNVLTGFRLLLVPVFVYYLTIFNDSTFNQWIAGIFYFVAAMTDVLDGYLARKNNQITNWGKIADPIADKALTGAAFIGLSLLGIIPWWITVVILVREIAVTILRFYVIRRGVIPASRGGKAKTLTQNIAIVAFLLPLPSLLEFIPITVLVIALVLTVATGIDYAMKSQKIAKEKGETN
jgi:CDP-diacylglycerol---glycerol-3-phosphate 3-phosphatidyltransferase